VTIDYDSPQQLVSAPQQVNEFICTRCIHVRQLSDLAADRSQGRVCRECAWSGSAARPTRPARA